MSSKDEREAEDRLRREVTAWLGRAARLAVEEARREVDALPAGEGIVPRREGELHRSVVRYSSTGSLCFVPDCARRAKCVVHRRGEAPSGYWCEEHAPRPDVVVDRPDLGCSFCSAAARWRRRRSPDRILRVCDEHIARLREETVT